MYCTNRSSTVRVHVSRFSVYCNYSFLNKNQICLLCIEYNTILWNLAIPSLCVAVTLLLKPKAQAQIDSATHLLHAILTLRSSYFCCCRNSKVPLHSVDVLYLYFIQPFVLFEHSVQFPLFVVYKY